MMQQDGNHTISRPRAALSLTIRVLIALGAILFTVASTLALSISAPTSVAEGEPIAVTLSGQGTLAISIDGLVEATGTDTITHVLPTNGAMSGTYSYVFSSSVEGNESRTITVTNTPGYADQTVAEHTMALMLATARQVPRLDRDTRSGGWNKGLPGFDLKGKTLGLIGLGGIGTRTAHLANAFGMRVIAWTRNPSQERANVAGVIFKNLDAVLAESDIVSLHLALTPDTENLLDSKRLAYLKQGAVLINTARAEIIDEDALIQALGNGTIGAAGFDVFHEEPLPDNHPLRDIDNVVITPHTGFNTPEATVAIIDIAIDSMAAYFAGNPINVVAALQ